MYSSMCEICCLISPDRNDAFIIAYLSKYRSHTLLDKHVFYTFPNSFIVSHAKNVNLLRYVEIVVIY